MDETTRVASPPSAGALRDAVRTSLAIGLTLLVARFFGEETAGKLSGAIEAGAVVIISAVLAFAGKVFRNNDQAAGTVV